MISCELDALSFSEEDRNSTGSPERLIDELIETLELMNHLTFLLKLRVAMITDVDRNDPHTLVSNFIFSSL